MITERPPPSRANKSSENVPTGASRSSISRSSPRASLNWSMFFCSQGVKSAASFDQTSRRSTLSILASSTTLLILPVYFYIQAVSLKVVVLALPKKPLLSVNWSQPSDPERRSAGVYPSDGRLTIAARIARGHRWLDRGLHVRRSQEAVPGAVPSRLWCVDGADGRAHVCREVVRSVGPDAAPESHLGRAAVGGVRPSAAPFGGVPVCSRCWSPLGGRAVAEDDPAVGIGETAAFGRPGDHELDLTGLGRTVGLLALALRGFRPCASRYARTRKVAVVSSTRG